jgi:glycolate oxidase
MEAPAELIERVRLVCGSEHTLTDPAALSTYRSDGIRRDGPLPLAVALPGDAAEVAGVVSACAQTGTPWVVRGAATSESGGALPLSDALLIALTRMRRILSVDLADDELTVEPGTPLVAIGRAVAPTHSFPIDHPGTVGGAAAAGALGSYMLGLDLVQGDGTLVKFAPQSPGYDVPGAFAGSRGMRGIAVALTLRAVPTR